MIDLMAEFKVVRSVVWLDLLVAERSVDWMGVRTVELIVESMAETMIANLVDWKVVPTVEEMAEEVVGH